MAIAKMIVILGVMFASRKLDMEDPETIYWLRIAYATVQSFVLMIVAYTYIQATMVAGAVQERIVYVPPPPQPFADPNAKKKYTETGFAAHVVSQARALVGSTLFGIALTAGLHYYRGMAMGLAMQAVLGPINIMENALVKAVVLGQGIRPEDKIFQEKGAEELTPDDEVVDESGNQVVRSITTTTKSSSSSDDDNKAFEEILLDTWDGGAKADLGPLMDAINKKNCNYKTKESGWTPLMILSGLGVKGSGSAIRQVKELGGNPAILDGEGWNAMHWAAFHGSAEAARALGGDGKLYLVQDKEGKTPLDHARTEKNNEVAKILEELQDELPKPKSDEGLRKRK